MLDMGLNGLIFSPKIKLMFFYKILKSYTIYWTWERQLAKKDKSIEQSESQEILTGNNDASQEMNSSCDNSASDGVGPPPSETICNAEKCDSGQPSSTQESISSEPTVEKLVEALAAEKDRVLRLSAEFENYKKRSSREMADFRKFANETILKQLLVVVDNLERAISSAAPGGDNRQQPGQSESKSTPEVQGSCIIQGVEMTYKDIVKLFEAFSVKPVKAQGQPFDPLFHQAVSNQESDEYPDNTVILELQKGYLLHDRLLRPSMVVVSKATSKKE